MGWQRVGLEGGLVWDFDNFKVFFIILGRAEVNQGGREEKSRDEVGLHKQIQPVRGWFWWQVDADGVHQRMQATGWLLA